MGTTKKKKLSVKKSKVANLGAVAGGTLSAAAKTAEETAATAKAASKGEGLFNKTGRWGGNAFSIVTSVQVVSGMLGGGGGGGGSQAQGSGQGASQNASQGAGG
jgi:hypothetical protein